MASLLDEPGQISCQIMDLARALPLDLLQVDAKHIAAATLSALLREKQIDVKVVTQAFKELGINPEKADPAIT